MECFFNSSLNENSRFITLDEDEYRHLRALRIKLNDSFYITNGKGLTASCQLRDFTKKTISIEVIEYHKNLNFPEKNIALALGILDNRDRFEFALEKAVELGVSVFIPLITKNSQKTIKLERLKAKAISALKQSLGSNLIQISEPVIFPDLVTHFNDYEQIILCDIDGEKAIGVENSVLIIVGPEGGLDKEEIGLLTENNKTKKLRINNRRLRAETAAIAAVSMCL